MKQTWIPLMIVSFAALAILFSCEQSEEKPLVMGTWQLVNEANYYYLFDGTDTVDLSFDFAIDDIRYSIFLRFGENKFSAWENVPCSDQYSVSPQFRYELDDDLLVLVVYYYVQGTQYTQRDSYEISGENGSLVMQQNWSESFSDTSVWGTYTALFQRWEDDLPPAEWESTMDGDEYEPDNLVTEANPISIGETVEGHNLSDYTDQDWFYFRGDSGTTYHIYTSGTLDTYLYLYESDGSTAISENDDYMDMNAYIPFSCEETGTYTLLVWTYDPWSDCGPYTLDLSLTAPAAGRTSLSRIRHLIP